MRKLLLSTALLGLMVVQANAATVLTLGANPNSITGAFSSSSFGGSGGTGLGAFDDQITFSLVGGPQFLTIASVTNVFASTADRITNFTGSVWFTGADGLPGGIGANADSIVIGPVSAGACSPPQAGCQGFAGSALLTLVGNYYLDLSGIGGGTSGYGGNLAVAQVPLPGALALFASGLVGLGWLSKKRKKSLNVA